MPLSLNISFDQVHKALRLWHKDNTFGCPLEQHPQYQLLRREGHGIRQATNRLLIQALEQLKYDSPEQSLLLTQRYLDGLPMRQVAHRLNRSESALFVQQREAIQQLTIRLNEMAISPGDTPYHSLPQHLPPYYRPVIGVDTASDALATILAEQNAPWIVSLEGIGGIGKTTLAHAVVYALHHRHVFYDIRWISAQQTHFSMGDAVVPRLRPALTSEVLIYDLAHQVLGDTLGSAPLSFEETLGALQERFHQQPYLIVLDNLETVQDVHRLLPTLRTMLGPTKFLLTSRESYYDESDLYHYVVPELNALHALALVRQEARIQNLDVLWEATDETLYPIYEVAGGNPLALRLIVGQSHIHDLSAVLHDLLVAEGKAEKLYSYIFRRAWHHLGADAREAWLVMPFVPVDGGVFDDLLAISTQTRTQFRRALDLLVTQNLVDVRGRLSERRYVIHGLTRSFLREAIGRWQ